ncbi:hypothetical protein pEaSNUABM54_00275 [Erwinia phage pEa_SNUABM_54]|nr:hypothetical protein pEaSNUABM54_00275 [Erwinia phage pEa_SNUABM_54]
MGNVDGLPIVTYNLGLLHKVRDWMVGTNAVRLNTIDVQSSDSVPAGESNIFETGLRAFDSESFLDIENIIKAFNHPHVDDHVCHVHVDRIYMVQDVLGIRIHVRSIVHYVPKTKTKE